jgi:glutamine amidotransferase
MSVAIIDYGSGNLHSAAKAFERAAAKAPKAQAINVTSDPEDLRRADRIVLPGVGAFADCRSGLERIDGMLEALEECTRGLEHGPTPGFDWIEGEVLPIAPKDSKLKIPHMGWNTLELTNPHPLLDGIATGEDGLHAYFVHSYHLAPAREEDLLARTDYGGAVTAMVARESFAGTQFHPEKSQKLGLRLIENFLEWSP